MSLRIPPTDRPRDCRLPLEETYAIQFALGDVRYGHRKYLPLCSKLGVTFTSTPGPYFINQRPNDLEPYYSN